MAESPITWKVSEDLPVPLTGNSFGSKGLLSIKLLERYTLQLQKTSLPPEASFSSGNVIHHPQRGYIQAGRNHAHTKQQVPQGHLLISTASLASEAEQNHSTLFFFFFTFEPSGSYLFFQSPALNSITSGLALCPGLCVCLSCRWGVTQHMRHPPELCPLRYPSLCFSHSPTNCWRVTTYTFSTCCKSQSFHPDLSSEHEV